MQEALNRIASPTRRRDAATLLAIMERVTGETPHLWGSIVGFGSYHYKYASGREGDAPGAGFAARSAAMSVYLPDGIGAHSERLARLGGHSVGVGCLYLKNLDRVDLVVLEEIIAASYRAVTAGAYYEYRAAESSTKR